MQPAAKMLAAMLSPKTQTNLTNAQSYFKEHLCVGDYYSEHEAVRGEWLGIGAASLGLSGIVEQEQFIALCENRNPQTGERLTARKKTKRLEGESELANRRVFFDFTLSPPKSVSIAALVGGETRIVEAHAAAVRVAMWELEQFATTRIRLIGAQQDRTTGNITAALFQHETSRALDPHLHTHCIVFNATYDNAEDRWKALQNSRMLAAQKYVENVYYHELAQELRKLGYTIANKARGDFELADIPREVCERFSKRHREIDEKTRTLLESASAKADGNIAEIRERIAHKSRKRKAPTLPGVKLRELWNAQLSDSEQKSLAASHCEKHENLSATDAIAWAEAHLFERRSIVAEHEIWRQALARGRGSAFSFEDLKSETAQRDYLRTKDGLITTREVLTREWNTVELVREGVGCFATFTPQTLWQREDLAADQQVAFAHILSSRHFVTLFRGGAGTGKSHVLRRVQDALTASAHETIVLAPQRQQVLDLGRDGLTNCQTVSEFLQRATLAQGSVIIVDEAGQIGGKQMFDLLTLAKRQGSRIILSGDTRQHGPVEASDALRAIERYGNMRPAELNIIRRQDPVRAKTHTERNAIKGYRDAVKAAANGELSASFDKLDSLGAIIESAPAEKADKLVVAYLALTEQNESAIVVSQTRAEVRDINDRIREGLRNYGHLGESELSLQALEAVDLTNAQKADARFLPPHAVAILRTSNGKQQIGRIVASTKSGVILDANSKLRKIRTADFDRLTICQARELTVSKGDRLQIKANVKLSTGKRLANGELVTIARIVKDGGIILTDGRTIPPEFRQFTLGYAVTSYGSQGKTVEHVLFSDAGERAATNAEQWYVTISRGRKSIRIFTPDKAALAASIERTGNRPLALDSFPHPNRKTLRTQLLRSIARGKALARAICHQVATRWKPTQTQKAQKSISP